MKELAMVTLNSPGEEAALRLATLVQGRPGDRFRVTVYKKGEVLSGPVPVQSYENLDALLESTWNRTDAFLFFAATGIVIRKVAPFLVSKHQDPAVLVADFSLQHIIPLLSGHVGGANRMALDLADLVPGCVAVLTTGTDQKELPAFDNFAKESGYRMENPGELARVSNALLNGKAVRVLAPTGLLDFLKSKPGMDHPLLAWKGLEEEGVLGRPVQDDGSEARVVLSPLPFAHAKDPALRITLGPLWIGCGLNRDTDIQVLEYAFARFFQEHGLGPEDVAGIASFVAKNDEEALLAFAGKYKFPLRFFSEEEINSLTQEFSESMAGKYFGIKGVAEPCAVLASSQKALVLKKHIYGDVTLAAAF